MSEENNNLDETTYEDSIDMAVATPGDDDGDGDSFEPVVDKTPAAPKPKPYQLSFWLDPDRDGVRGLNKASTAGLTVIMVAIVLCGAYLMGEGIITVEDIQKSGGWITHMLTLAFGVSGHALFSKRKR